MLAFGRCALWAFYAGGRSENGLLFQSLLCPDFFEFLTSTVKSGHSICLRSELSFGKLSGERSAFPQSVRSLRCYQREFQNTNTQTQTQTKGSTPPASVFTGRGGELVATNQATVTNH